MKLTRSFKIALNIILHSKIRSWLTIIGIVIGIAAVVSIVSIGQGAQKNLEQNLNSLSADVLTITSGMSRAQGAGAAFRGGDFGGPGGFGGGGRSGGSSAKNLTVSDVMVLKSISNIQYITGIVTGTADNISYIGKTSRASIQGVDPLVYKNFMTTSLASGRYLTQGDENVVVIGGSIANRTFSGIEINRQIAINGKLFRIVGILQQSGGNDDSKIFMPIDNAIIILDNKNKKYFDSILVKIKDIALTDDTVTQITDKLMLSHGILQASKQDFSIASLKSIQQRVSTTLSSTSLFLTAIAIISLIVGAIGIMNTMFTSVLEKTREIGILKAIGAKDRDILTIFLLNSGIIGFIGGVFGILVGIIASDYIGQLSGTSALTGGGGPFGRMLSSTYVSPSLIIGVFLLSIVIGLVAGAIPAYRASRLEPVEALRYE